MKPCHSHVAGLPSVNRVGEGGPPRMARRHDYFASLNLSAAIQCSSQTPDGFEAGLPLQPTGAERPVRSGRRSIISNLWGVQLVAKKRR